MNTWRRLVGLDLIPLLGLLLAAGLWLASVVTVPLNQPIPALYHTEPIGEIRGQQTVGQTFLVPYDGLHRIDVSLADYGHTRTGPVYFRLATGPGEPVLAEIVIRAEEIRGDVRYSFEFPAVPDSAGRRFYFELTAPEAASGNAITAYIQPSGLHTGGQAYFAGQPVPGDLVFDLSFQVSGWERARIWLGQAAEAKPGVWGEPWFYVLLGLAYIGLVAAVFWGLRRVFAPEAG